MDRIKEWWSNATTKKRVLAVFVLFVVLGLIANAASAQQGPVCGGDEITQELRNSWGEQPVSTMMTADGAVQVWASEEGESWTILVLFPDGRICAVIAGDTYEHHGAIYGEAM